LGDDLLRESWNTITLNSSGASSVALATLLVSGTPDVVLFDGASGTTAADSNFKLVISSGTGDGSIYSGNVNLVDTTSPVYIETLFPRNNTVDETTIALNHVFGNASDGLLVSSGSTATFTHTAGDPMYVDGYSAARTPVIVGDVADAVSAGVSLFTIHTLTDGYAANIDIKIAIENIDTVNNTFDLLVRSYSDTNAAQTLLEKYPRLSMDSTDAAYIARVIGDSPDETGDYTLISK